MQLMVPKSLIKNNKYDFIRNNLPMAVMYGATLQRNFLYRAAYDFTLTLTQNFNELSEGPRHNELIMFVQITTPAITVINCEKTTSSCWRRWKPSIPVFWRTCMIPVSWSGVREKTLKLNWHQLDRTRNSCQFSAESPLNSSNNSWQHSTTHINNTSQTDCQAHHG